MYNTFREGTGFYADLRDGSGRRNTDVRDFDINRDLRSSLWGLGGPDTFLCNSVDSDIRN